METVNNCIAKVAPQTNLSMAIWKDTCPADPLLLSTHLPRMELKEKERQSKNEFSQLPTTLSTIPFYPISLTSWRTKEFHYKLIETT